MRPKTLGRLCGVAVLGSAAAASAAWAQAAPQAPQEGMRARMEAMRQAHEAERAQDLRTILRLRPDQEPALTAFLASHKRPDRPMEGAPPSPPPGPMTTAQRLDLEARHAAAMAAERQKRADALRAFYAALSPDQRQVFDALQRMEHGGPDGFHGRRFGGPGFAFREGPPDRSPWGPPPPGDD